MTSVPPHGAPLLNISTPPLSQQTAAIHLAILVAATSILILLLPGGRSAVGGAWPLKLLFLSRMASLLLLATWLLRREGLGWPAVGLRRPPLWPTLIAIPAGLIATVAAVGLVKQLLSHTGVPAADYSVFRPLRGNLAEYLFWLLPVTVGSAAFGEEMIFRGMLLHEGRTLLGKGRLPTLLAILLQAAFFGVLHSYQGIGGIAITTTVGLMLGLVWLFARRNLWPGIIIHILFDASSMTALYLGIPIS